MAIKSKSQLAADISANIGAKYDQTDLQTVLDDIVDSYEDIFAQVTTVQRDALTPTNGLIVYNTDSDRYEYWNGVDWFGIGQDISTPMTVKVDLDATDLSTLFATPVTLVSAPGTGYSIVPNTVAFRFTYGTTQYDFATGLFVYTSGKTRGTDYFATIQQSDINAAANRSGTLYRTGYGIDGIDEDSDILIAAGTSNPTTGDGTLTIWITYSIVVW